MRTNYITQLTENTRCRVLNDPTTYMAKHFFSICEITSEIIPCKDFTIVDEVEFFTNQSTKEKGFLSVYEGEKTFKDGQQLYIVHSISGAYKMFIQEDFNEVVSELQVKTRIVNKILDNRDLIINKAKRDRLVVIDSSTGLLANKTDDEVLQFFEENGRVVKSLIIDNNGTLVKVDKKETQYYVMIDNIVYNKRFSLDGVVKEISTSNYIESERFEITLENIDEVLISSNGIYLKKGNNVARLTEKYKKDKNVYMAERYVVKDIVASDEVIEVLKEACITMYGVNSYSSISEYLEELRKKDIFHLFSM